MNTNEQESEVSQAQIPDGPERRNPAERKHVSQKIEETWSRRRPVDGSYPYFFPDYRLPFVHIGTEKQLFVDNFMLDHLDGVERVFPTPDRPDKPILEVGELPWEQVYSNPVPTAALYDENDGKFKMWYSQTLTGDPFNTGQVLCYAESTDCINWVKPLSKECLPYGEHKTTNIVCEDTAAVTVVLNHDQSDPSRRFLMIYCPYSEAKRRGVAIMSTVAASPDGIKWTTISEDTPYRHQHENRIIWDESIEKWIGFSQYSHHWHIGNRTRKIGRQESEDFINWSPKEVVLSADSDPNLPPDVEYGCMSVRKVGGLYIGIVDEYICEPLWCVHKQNGANWRDQLRSQFGLYTSRDGLSWHRVGKVPSSCDRSPKGTDSGACFFGCASGQLIHQGRVFIPYLASPYKQWVTGRVDDPVLVPEAARVASEELLAELQALGDSPYSESRRRYVGAITLREDGWAMLKPVSKEGRAYTKQFVFEGDCLRINADCARGWVRVQVLDPNFKPYKGFSYDDCDPIHEDGIWHTVSWNNNNSVSSLWNKPCRLEFDLSQAGLFAFQFEQKEKLQCQ